MLHAQLYFSLSSENGNTKLVLYLNAFFGWGRLNFLFFGKPWSLIEVYVLSQPVDECKEETPIDVVGDNDIKQEPDFPEVKFTLAGTTESSLDGMEET